MKTFTQQEKTLLRILKKDVNILKNNVNSTSIDFQLLFDKSRQLRMDLESNGHDLMRINKIVGFNSAYKDFMLNSGNDITLAEWAIHIAMGN